MMPMSVGICECGCTEFGHTVGCPDDLPEKHWGNWQTHKCDATCHPKCEIQLCKDAGDGYWTWCNTCDIQCSGHYDSYNDEPDGPHDWGECFDDDCDICYNEPSSVNKPDWPPALHSQIRVNFTSELLTVVERIVISDTGDPVRESTLSLDWSREVHAVYATDKSGTETLIQLDDL